MKIRNSQIDEIIVNSAPFMVLMMFFELLYYLYSVNAIYTFDLVFLAGTAGTAVIITAAVLVQMRKNYARLLILFFFDVHLSAVIIYYILNFRSLLNIHIRYNFYFQFRMVLALFEIFFVIFLSRKKIRLLFN